MMTTATERVAASRSDGGLVTWLWLGAGTTATAGILHLFAAAEHAGVNDLAAASFVLTAATQLGIAFWLTLLAGRRAHPRPILTAAALATTVGFIGAFVLAYTATALAGYLGHAPEHSADLVNAGLTPIEAPGWIGLATVAAELISLAALVALLPDRWRRRAADGLLGLAGLTWVLWIVGVLR